MCNRYVSPDQAEIERVWHVGARDAWRGGGVYPRKPGPYVRSNGVGERELVVGRWGLVPSWWPKSLSEFKASTNNARGEELDTKRSFRGAWRRSQRCIIPATAFDEPCWETLRNVWWQFRRADGQPWGLAGLWDRWGDRSTGEVVESYSMITLNANAHPLMSRMHKPEVDPITKEPLPLHRQDKRSVVALEAADWDAWLRAPVEEARALMRLSPVETFDAGPEPAVPALF